VIERIVECLRDDRRGGPLEDILQGVIVLERQTAGLLYLGPDPASVGGSGPSPSSSA